MLQSYSGYCDITRWDPLMGPINYACSDSGHKFELFSITQAQSEQQEKFQQRGKNLPQVWGGFIQITPGYGNLGFKSSLCWKQLDHTKGRHTKTILTENQSI